MTKSVFSLVGASILVMVAQVAFGQNVIQIGDETFKVYVGSVESASSFPAYEGDTLSTVNASGGNVLARVKITVDNVTKSKQPFKIGNIQMTGDDKKLSVIAVGLKDHPDAIKASDRNRAENRVEIIESRKDTTGGSYRFPIYIFEAPKNSTSWKLSFNGGKWVELKGREKKSE
jgi:hypothetical protein